jgi:hypothetical protein
MTFAQIVEAMSSHDELFVTDFLHFLKCLRNRLSIHLLTLYHQLTPVAAENLSKVLLIGNYLEPKILRVAIERCCRPAGLYAGKSRDPLGKWKSPRGIALSANCLVANQAMNIT